jgi:hypothetical protein
MRLVSRTRQIRTPIPVVRRKDHPISIDTRLLSCRMGVGSNEAQLNETSAEITAADAIYTYLSRGAELDFAAGLLN